MDVHVEHSQKGIRIAFTAIGLNGRADQRLREDEVCEVVWVEELSVGLEKLDDKALQSEVVDGGIGVEKVKVDIHEALLSGCQ